MGCSIALITMLSRTDIFTDMLNVIMLYWPLLSQWRMLLCWLSLCCASICRV